MICNDSMPENQVICVCGGYGFPAGNAGAARITIVGRALRAGGIGFRLLHCGPSPIAVNTQRSGVYEGIPFEYTTVLRRPANAVARFFVYMWAICGLTARLARLRPVRSRTAVYLYHMEGPLNLYTGCLCRILGLPIVQELCEWMPGEPTCSSFTKWLHRKPLFKAATGVLAISKAIEERVRERALEVNPHLLVHRLPAIVDAHRFAVIPPLTTNRTDQLSPSFVYCGTWLRDVFFLIRAFTLVKLGGFRCKLTIVGDFGEVGQAITKYAVKKGLQAEDIVLSGWIDEPALAACYKTAAALLMPLADDDRSVTRLPNKMGEYLASGRPVVTCKIGDLTDFLIDNVNAYLAEPGNERDFATKMIAVLQDPARAEQIGAAGQHCCLSHLDYRAHVGGLSRFFVSCIGSHQTARSTWSESGRMHRGYRVVRNCFCGLLALGLIASGRVRRARNRALRGDAVTAIYFHKPNKLLFGRCIRWLTRHGYTFISADDLFAVLYLGKTAPPGAVWLSFDDGCKQLSADVLPLTHEHKLPVTLFIPTGIIGDDGRLPWLHEKTNGNSSAENGRDTLSIVELQQIATYPEVTIASHTVNHAVTAGLTRDEVRFELAESKRTLESWIETEVKYFAYPVGKFDGRERPVLAECGYALAVTTENAFITRETDPYLIPRFAIGDEISFPEAICNMVGVWRPMIDRIITFLRRTQLTALCDGVARLERGRPANLPNQAR